MAPSTLPDASADLADAGDPHTAVAHCGADAADPDRRSPATLAALSAFASFALQACGGGGSDAAAPATQAPTAGSFAPTADTATAGTAGDSDARFAPMAAEDIANVAGGTAGPLGAARAYPAPASDADAARFLLQAQFSASDEEIAAVRAQGYAAWLAGQFAMAPDISAWDWLNQRGYAAIDNATRYYDATYPADYMIWSQLMTGRDAVRQRVALALSEIFVVSVNGVETAWRSHLMASWWDMLSANALGSYRQLLEDVTLHPAMGVYLNTRGNQKENAATGRQPDENYARELMQLMTIGVSRLNADGSVQRGADGLPLDSYTQADVTNLARVFTGYDFDQSQNVNTVEPVQNRTVGNTAFARLPMTLRAALHSTQDVNFLGTRIAGSTDGATARRMALDALFAHENVGPFIARQLIQRLVTSNPGGGYVARVAAVFANNGRGVRGDLGAVVAAILLDDDARGPAGLRWIGFGHLREPMLRLVQWGRTFGLQSARGSWKIGDQSNPATQLGQSPLRSGSVFNFFRPGYVPPNTIVAAAGGVAPEFQLVNESSVGGYLNFLQSVVRNGFYVNAPDVPAATSNGTNGYDITAAYTREKAIAHDTVALILRLNLLLAAGQLSYDTMVTIYYALIATPVKPTDTDAVKLNRIAAAVLLVMASPEYLIQK
ncbi:DUF1800 family protein [uncultured Xylophilus sp.]|uniref:DUF1800 domain-containing protein n=1 Tax=uncultured Xylophilus sp. TaxID=296832 RepID=UPI0025F732D1|nr:DUF1800 family protein [uncultured Xylophilus sp.]